MRTTALLFTISAMLMCGKTAAQTDTLAIDTTFTLGEITVNGVRKIQKADRQLLIPTKQMKRSADDGYELLRLLNLDGIKIDPVQQSVSSLRGGSVQLRINDVKATTQDILALRPDEVVRVEHIDNPGVRYSDENLDAVINYVVKRRYAGYVGGISTHQAFTTGFNNSSAYFKYNYKKSEFGIQYGFNHRGYDQRRFDEKTDYYFPDGTEHHRNEIGYDSDFMYVGNNVQLSYNLAEPEKYNLNVRFAYNGFNNPCMGTNQRIEENGQPDLYSYNEKKSKRYPVSLDIYYSANLPHSQNIAANVVGTYMKSDYQYLMREYLFNLSPEHSMQTAPLNDYSYATKGEKLSLISEAIYSKTWEKISLSAGGEFTISRTDNRYSGSVGTHALLNSDNLYFFTQLQGKLAWLNYQIGIGANRSSIRQGDIGYDKWTFRPRLFLQCKPAKNVSLSLTGRVYQHTPSLSQLSDVRQQSNSLTASLGNMHLKPYSSYQGYLTVSWNVPAFNLWLNGGITYIDDAIMDSYIPEQLADGSYIITSLPENQRSFINRWVQANFTLHAIKDVLDINLYGMYDNYDSRGLTYRHTFDTWQYGVSANLTLGKWAASYQFSNTPKSFYGETMSGGENMSNLDVSYKLKNLRIGLGALLVGYPQGFKYPGFIDSRYYKSNYNIWIKDNGNMVYVTFSYNFSHGRKYETENRKLNNSDNDSGIK